MGQCWLLLLLASYSWWSAMTGCYLASAWQAVLSSLSKAEFQTEECSEDQLATKWKNWQDILILIMKHLLNEDGIHVYNVSTDANVSCQICWSVIFRNISYLYDDDKRPADDLIFKDASRLILMSSFYKIRTQELKMVEDPMWSSFSFFFENFLLL